MSKIDPEDDLIARIQETLKHHGFPQHSVALPFPALRDAAIKRGIELTMVLDRLEMMSVYAAHDEERIIFSAEPLEEENEDEDDGEAPEMDSSEYVAEGAKARGGPFGDIYDLLKGMDLSGGPQNLQAQIAAMMERLSPEQQEKIVNTWMTMDPAQRQKIMEEGKKMGLNP
ncbi:MAG: hypothetical protein RL095_3659 [Verrucomicrobiota bacterium]|jgi:hypothetical protein